MTAGNSCTFDRSTSGAQHELAVKRVAHGASEHAWESSGEHAPPSNMSCDTLRRARSAPDALSGPE